MKASMIIVLTLSLALSVYAQTPCFARITASKRAGSDSSWESQSTSYQVYDITATNEGSCDLLRVVGFFSATDGTIGDTWNYDKTSGLITGYGEYLAVGQTFTGAGFIVANSSAVTLAFDRPGCDDSCYATTPAPSTPSPTDPISPGTGTSSSSSSNCTVTLTQTTETSTGDNGETLNTYNITITNTGVEDVVTPVFFITLIQGPNLGIVSTSGLVTYATTVAGQILVSLPPNTVIPAGTTYTSASYVTNDTTTGLRLSSCIADGSPASSSDDDSGDSPSTPSPSDSPSTPSPSSSPSSTTCTVTPTLTRDAYHWVSSDGRNTSVYRLTITNTGPCALTDYTLSFSYYPGEILSMWNLVSSLGGYRVTNFGGALAAGAEYNGAGLIIAGAPDQVSADPYGANCAC